MSPGRRTALVLLAAVLGIAVAAAVTWGTSLLVSQKIGLSSEPLTAGRTLLPSSASAGAARPREATTAASPRTPPQPTTQATASAPAAPASPAAPAPAAPAPAAGAPAAAPASESAADRERRAGKGEQARRASGDD